jgi:hypothetical protein
VIGSGFCLGPPCPHDHGDPAVCTLCGNDFWTTEQRDLCVPCAPLAEMDAAELRALVVEQRHDIATLRRARLRQEVADAL